MQTYKLEVGKKPKIEISSIGGDLRLSGREDTQFEAKVPSDNELQIEHKDNVLRFKCPKDCLIFLPRESSIEIETVGGDLRAINITGGLSVRKIGGDLSLRGIGEVTIETVGGDLHARRGTGDITIDRVGGDASADRISGDVHIKTIGSDLALQRVDGSVQASPGGDASLAFSTVTGEKIGVQAGGDLSCRFPKDISVSITLQAGGDLTIPESLTLDESSDGTVFTIGEGEIPVNLKAGGDLLLKVSDGVRGTGFTDLGSTIAAQVESELETEIAQMEVELGALDEVFGSGGVGDQVRSAVTRARRRADRAKRRAARQARKHHKTIKLSLGNGKREKGKISEEERLSILRMLEKGIITVEESEKLLQALEGDA